MDAEEMRNLEMDDAVSVQMVSPVVSLPSTSVVGLLCLCNFFPIIVDGLQYFGAEERASLELYGACLYLLSTIAFIKQLAVVHISVSNWHGVTSVDLLFSVEYVALTFESDDSHHPKVLPLVVESNPTTPSAMLLGYDLELLNNHSEI